MTELLTADNLSIAKGGCISLDDAGRLVGVVVPKILLVDDDTGLRRLVRLTLGPDYDVIEATDGQEAIDLTRRERPDLIFMDIRMPRLSGYEACRRIKESPDTSQTKIVMLTANTRDEDRERGVSVGCDAYLTKPYSPLALLAKVEELIGVAELR